MPILYFHLVLIIAEFYNLSPVANGTNPKRRMTIIHINMMI